MKMKIVVTAAVFVCSAALTLQAQTNDMVAQNPNPNTPMSGDLYRPYELSVDAFGLGTVSEYTLDHLSGRRIAHHGHLGAGFGGEYFINKYVGFEAESFSESTHHSFVDDLGGNLVLRLPIGQTGLAPYVFGGGGHSFDPTPGTYGDGGAGVEYRFNPHFGIFTDGRFVTTDNVGNYGLGRLGFRFTF